MDNLAYQDRLRAIEILLLWEGSVSNTRLRALIGCNSTYASRLITTYSDYYPNAIRRVRGDTKGWYRATRYTAPALSLGSIEEYLVLTAGQYSPHLNVIQADYSTHPPRLFGGLHQLAQLGHGARVTYYSLNRPEGVERSIWPHALVGIGQRWHVRAYTDEHGAFRDFNLGRFDTRFETIKNPSPMSPVNDDDWHTTVTVCIKAHYQLEGPQQRVIEREYFNQSAMRQLQLRACLVSYTLQAMRVATDVARHQPPEYLLQLANPEAVREWLLD